MINVKEKKTERTEKIGKGQTAPKRKKTATVERIAQAIGSKRFLAIVLCCCAWAVFHAVNMYAVYSDLLKRVRDALPIYSGEEMQRFAELTSDLIYTFRVTAGIYCILECILPIAAAAAFAAVHCDARRGQLAEGSGIPLLRMTLAMQFVIGIAAAVTLCLLVVCAAELEQDIIIFRKTVLNIIATPPPVFTPMRIAAIIITSGGINAALCTLECFFVPHVRKCSKSAFCGAERRQGGNTAAGGGISAVRSRACFGGVRGCSAYGGCGNGAAASVRLQKRNHQCVQSAGICRRGVCAFHRYEAVQKL